MMIIISMKLLLTVCFGCLATDPNNLRVIQTPTNINLSAGDSTEITCIWEKAVERYRACWYFVNKVNITKSISSKVLYSSNITCENKDVLVIKSANVNDTGFYYCEIIIEIPFFKKLCGNGTTVIVEEKAHSLERRYLEAWAILPFIAAVGSLYLCYKKKKPSTLSGAAQLPVLTARQEQEQEQRLEVEELHGRNESTREAAEENSSSNSAEWAVSLLYESLESFCNESGGKDDKSTVTVVSNGEEEQIPETS
ncbi:uncharacterized protein LOC127059497 [Serinus canaria]|uniref:uncharacterized protein LOC127059497 n=1 Tax=Serinus canaria TaxID=9135 RepID=UPI0008DB4A8F|nr:uncharacterized protein LOC127059497 [Serinus canaria]